MHLNSLFKLVHKMTIQNWWTTGAEGRNLCVSRLEHVPRQLNGAGAYGFNAFVLLV